jgi:peptidoglycan/LPS O-acetylase OafA/YrhL
MMFYVYVYILPLVVLMLAGGLLYWQTRAWRRVQQEENAGEDLEYARRQFGRRVQTSAMMALLAVGLCLGQLIARDQHPTLFVLFWLGMLLLLAWMVLMALGDLVLGRQRLARLARERRIAEAQLTAELDRLRDKLKQEGDHNGQHAHQQP